MNDIPRLKGTQAATRALSCLGDEWLASQQKRALRQHVEPDGFEYADASVLEFALCKALEAAYPAGALPMGLTRNDFVLKIINT